MVRTRHYGIYFKKFNKLIVITLIILLVVFNVVKFCRYAESNDAFIVEYTPETDALKDFRTPLLLEMYFMEKYSDKKDLKIVLLSADERFLDQQVSELLLKKIMPYKHKQAVFVFDDKNAKFADELAEITHLNPQKAVRNEKKLSENMLSLIEKNKLVFFICDDEDAQTRQTVINIAKQLNLRPDVLNLKYKLPARQKQKNDKKPELTLDNQENNLRNFIKDYKNQLQAFLNDVSAGRYDMPEYSASAKHLFDKGAIQVLVIDKNDNKKYQFGNISADTALARAFISGVAAAKNKKTNAEYRFYILTKTVKKKYSSEKDFLNDINAGSDGIMLVNGYRQAIFLPYFWKDYPDKKEFVKNLKINAGLSPDYWSKQIKIFYFRAVEVKYAD